MKLRRMASFSPNFNRLSLGTKRYKKMNETCAVLVHTNQSVIVANAQRENRCTPVMVDQRQKNRLKYYSASIKIN